MFTLRYSKQAIKTVAKIPQGVAVKIRNELNIIAMDPSTYRGDWKPMKGTTFWRLRVGDWRAICEIIDDELIVYVHRTCSQINFAIPHPVFTAPLPRPQSQKSST